MTEETTAVAKRASRSVGRVPFGSPALDGRFSGIPAGSAVLLAGAPDAGTDAFAYTHAAALLTARYYPGLYDGRVADPDCLPDAVHYVTLDRSRRHLLHEMDAVLGARQFNTLTDHLHVEDHSEAFLDLLPMPAPLRRAGRDGPSPRKASPDADGDAPATFDALLTDVSDHLVSVAAGDLVVFDSLTALTGASAFGLSEGTVLGFLGGLRRAAEAWGGLVAVVHHARPETVRADEVINTALHGCLYFYTNDSGMHAQKTMRVGEFGGALSRRRQVVYDTAVSDAGFTVSSSRRV
jgi:archaellum biogenesis ATPase FlaH